MGSKYSSVLSALLLCLLRALHASAADVFRYLCVLCDLNVSSVLRVVLRNLPNALRVVQTLIAFLVFWNLIVDLHC